MPCASSEMNGYDPTLVVDLDPAGPALKCPMVDLASSIHLFHMLSEQDQRRSAKTCAVKGALTPDSLVSPLPPHWRSIALQQRLRNDIIQSVAA